MTYEGKTYKAPSGQWSWVITKEEVDIARGAGYSTQDDAEEEMQNELAEQQSNTTKKGENAQK